MNANENGTPVLVSFNRARASTAGWTGSDRGTDYGHAIRGARQPHLTQRELDVLALLAQGFSNKLIARDLKIAGSTVKCHVANILRELGVDSRLRAVVAAHHQGLVDMKGEAAGNRPQDGCVRRDMT